MDLQIKPIANCSDLYGSTYVGDTNLCASGSDGKSFCSGDGGSPFTVNIGTEKVLVGLASFIPADGCELGYNSVLTKTSSYLTWITDNTV